MSYLSAISGYNFPSVRAVFSSNTYIQAVKNISTIALNCLSPKQSVRPDPLSETVRETAFKLRMNLAIIFWKIGVLFSKQLLSKEGEQYLKVLTTLATDKELAEPETAAVNLLFSKINDKTYLDKFDFIVASSTDFQVKKQHKILKDLFTLCDPTFYSNFKDKLKKLGQLEDLEQSAPLPEKEKLSLEDINALIGIDLAKSLLKKIKGDLNGVDSILSKLSELERLLSYPFFDKLKRLCLESRPSGTFFLADKRTIQLLNGYDFDCAGIIHQLVFGRLCHIGIFVNPEGKGLHLSHVNRITKNHAVVPIRNPLVLPFSYSLRLDISPLIPASLSAEKKEELAGIFLAAFQQLASVLHPELPLAGAKSHVKLAIMGHKTIFSQQLAQVEFPPANTPTMCSTYVGIVFLKAVQKMNQVLESQGILERIPHPFGEHENLMNLDILRFVYLLKSLGVAKMMPADEKLSKFFSSSSHFSSS